MLGSVYRLEAKHPQATGHRPQANLLTSHKIMTVWDSLIRGAAHTLDGEASAQHNSEEDPENEKDGHEGGRAVEAYKEKEEDKDNKKLEPKQSTRKQPNVEVITIKYAQDDELNSRIAKLIDRIEFEDRANQILRKTGPFQ